MDPHTQRAEAERWLGIAAKLMTARDFLGSKTFAMRAREADPNNPVSDQILAVIETILAGEKRVNASQQPDWYSILQLPRLVRDPDLIADHYRRLVMCLNPERNRFPFADYALQLVMDAWSVLSDPTKKWLFDNELALFLQQQPQPQQQQQQQQSDAGAVAAVAAAAGGSQLNTFQFFQQQPQQPQQQQPSQQQQQQPMWQLQQPQHQQNQQQQQHQQQINQREFMPLPQTQTHTHTQSVSQQQQQHQQVPPQWQMRDPTPIKGGERNKQVLNGIGVGVASTNIQTPTPMVPTQAATATIMRPVPQAPPPAPLAVQHPQPPQQQPVMAARVTVAAAGNVVDGNAGNVLTTANTSINNNAATNNNNNNNAVGIVNGVDDNAVDEDNEDVVEEVDCFWTACPYCFYIYEYPKVYQECTLRCQNCRKAFHAVQIPNPPPVSSSNGKEKEKEKGKGKGKEKEKEKEEKGKEKDNSFCCWGFFPLGFSMTAWKKQQNQGGNMNGPSSWVPFSPMFASPAANGGGNFHWFGNGGGNAFVGPKHAVAKSTPRVYIDDDDEDFVEFSESSDSSDDDWRTYKQNQELTKGKKRRKRRGNVGGRRKGRPPKGDVVKQVNHNVASGGGVSVGGEELGDGATNAQEVVFSLAAGDRSNSSKSMPATLTRKQTRRSVKDVGRLDLNVEFNNDGEEHAPTVSAVNGEEDGIENIAFFDGLDEFLSTLPILNVGGDEKAKPS